VFRRSSATSSTVAEPATPAGGKGRPTPSRKEAEAARRARAKGPQDKKGAARLDRQRRAESTARMRRGLKTGEERYLPARDKGPVRRFVRDYVDARLCMAELLLPLLVVIMATAAFAPRLSNGLWTATILVIALDSVWLVFRLRRELARRFPGGDAGSPGVAAGATTKGAVLYGVMRSIQLRWIRLPKPQVKLGARLPDRY